MPYLWLHFFLVVRLAKDRKGTIPSWWLIAGRRRGGVSGTESIVDDQARGGWLVVGWMKGLDVSHVGVVLGMAQSARCGRSRRAAGRQGALGYVPTLRISNQTVVYLPLKWQLGSFLVALTVTPRFIKCLGSTGAPGQCWGWTTPNESPLATKTLGDGRCTVLGPTHFVF